MNMPRTAGAIVTEDSLLLSIEKDALHRFLETSEECKQEVQGSMQRMVMEQIIKCKIPFFSEMNHDDIMKMSGILGIDDTLEANQVIVQQGDVGDRFYVVLNGEVSVQVDQKQENIMSDQSVRRVEVFRGGVGFYFGELSLVLKDSVRTATVITITPCVVVSIKASDMFRYFEDSAVLFSEIKLKMLGNKCSLDTVLLHKDARRLFQEHLKREFGEENIQFYDQIEKFRKWRKFEGVNPENHPEDIKEAKEETKEDDVVQLGPGEHVGSLLDHDKLGTIAGSRENTPAASLRGIPTSNGEGNDAAPGKEKENREYQTIEEYALFIYGLYIKDCAEKQVRSLKFF
jgi:CRP-like cAMP-binding protein